MRPEQAEPVKPRLVLRYQCPNCNQIFTKRYHKQEVAPEIAGKIRQRCPYCYRFLDWGDVDEYSPCGHDDTDADPEC